MHGKNKLTGEVTVSGAKNSALPVVVATLLCDVPVILENCPQISDIRYCLKILSVMGADVKVDGNNVMIDTSGVKTPEVPYEMATKMRASSYFLGALLGRFHKAHVALPGGCAIGDRPIDMHLKAFNALGAHDSLESSQVILTADRLVGSFIYFGTISVGATINAMLASVKADGLTVIENAAKEPHVVDVANFLNSVGADIRGAGTDTIKVHGVKALNKKNVSYSIIPDQIEAGTFMAAIAATHGDALVRNVIPKHLDSIISVLRSANVGVDVYDDYVRVYDKGPITQLKIKTQPHPGFPTDMQPQLAALLTMAEGTSTIVEEVFQSRFGYAAELRKFGANCFVNSNTLSITGVKRLTGAIVEASDLRAGAALVIAGLIAEGETVIKNINFVERGYEGIEKKLRAMGADIERVSSSELSGMSKEA